MTIYSENLALTLSDKITNLKDEDAELVVRFIEEVLPSNVACEVIDMILARYGHEASLDEFDL